MSREVVWITGGGTGIGRALALEYARRGAAVAVSGRRIEPLEEVVREVEQLGGRGLALRCDTTDELQVRETVQRVIDTFGRMDTAIANAGVSVSGNIEDMVAAEWRRQMDINVVGVAITAAAALPALRASKGRLGIVGSVAGFIATPGSGAYNASKFAVRAMVLTLAQELHGSGVSVIGIYPGFVESDIARVDNQGVFHPDRPDPRPQRLMWKAADAARVCVRAIDARRREFVFTGHGKLGAWLGMHFPGLVHFVITRFGMRQAESYRKNRKT